MAETIQFDPAPHIDLLTDLQRRTVEHVCRRFFTDRDTTRQFLVADEVGLGKTMVARGVIAHTIRAFWDKVERIDILYICSNNAIAQQNLERLNVMGHHAHESSGRLTLQAINMKEGNGQRRNKVNFISLTPRTTFNLQPPGGRIQERALILHLLEDMLDYFEGADILFQSKVGRIKWKNERKIIKRSYIDGEIRDKFRAVVKNDGELITKINDLCKEIICHEEINDELRSGCTKVLGQLRYMLALVSVTSFEPNLIILDEFQRFHELLSGDDTASCLAQKLFNYNDILGNSAKLLLLSATPYRMLTLTGDDPKCGEHHRGFMEVLKFLFGPDEGNRRCDEIEMEFRRFREAMQDLPAKFEDAMTIRQGIEEKLCRVISRTERVSETNKRDAMIREVPHKIDLHVNDLKEARVIAKVARAVGASENLVEYWKSSPWMLNFMHGYKISNLLRDQSNKPSDELLNAMNELTELQISPNTIKRYRELIPPNGRMRKLNELVMAKNMPQRLWIAPSLPYFGQQQQMSKFLIFSDWTMVPDAIAGFLSYEAERCIERKQTNRSYSYWRLPTTRPLRFGRSRRRLSSDRRLTGLRALQLVIPSPKLAMLADPLRLMRDNGPFSDYKELRRAATKRLRSVAEGLLNNHEESIDGGGWDWSSPASLDIDSSAFAQWLAGPDLRRLSDEDAWSDHIAALEQAAKQKISSVDLNTLLSHLVDVALGSPATCALRALSRVAPNLPLDDPELLTAATWVGMAFRTLFNRHEAQALLRAGAGRNVYWRSVMAYAAKHDLQSVLDEYVHVIFEPERHTEHTETSVVTTIAKHVCEVLSLRSAQVELNHFHLPGREIKRKRIPLRSRFAMRLTPKAEEDGGVIRAGLVRRAFNSPFHPFVLASTSIGQEGLDFHPYCHSIVHWNLPRNPVDLEQREGRIHRYKNHAVRLNLAVNYVNIARQCNNGDPWAAMFKAAYETAQSSGDLEPFWILDGHTKIERHILSLPFSREEIRSPWLKRSVAYYRLAFGQPRQDDLLLILDKAKCEFSNNELDQLQINLRPPS